MESQSAGANFTWDGEFWDKKQLRKASKMKQHFRLGLEQAGQVCFEQHEQEGQPHGTHKLSMSRDGASTWHGQGQNPTLPCPLPCL